MFTITFFLILGVVILALIAIAVAVESENSKVSKRFGWIFFVVLSFLGIASIMTVRQYLYPSDPEVFSNADYHIIEHKGFEADKELYLVRGRYPDDYHPETSLWDSKSGVIRIAPNTIDVADYYEPFFVENKGGEHVFVLSNKTVGVNVETDGLDITKTVGNSTYLLYHLSVVEEMIDRKHTKVHYISSSYDNLPDTSTFDKPIKLGYPLSEIISQSPHFKFSEELQDLLDGVFLVRERIPITNSYGSESSELNHSPLLLFPGNNLSYSNDILINGAGISPDRSFHIPFEGRTMFYSGIGRTKTDIYTLSVDSVNGLLSIMYVVPKMYKLRNGTNRLFITSSIAEILDDARQGGYYYGIFDNDNNVHHINGAMHYTAGNALENMSFEITDIYSDNPSAKKTVHAGDVFNLTPRDKDNGGINWVFDIKDLRETSSLRFIHVFLFVFIFIAMVGIRILTDSLWRQNSLSYFELSVYTVIFCLCVVRLIIGWRVSTFVPIDEVSATMFDTMRNGARVWYYTLIAVGFPLMMVIVPVIIRLLGKFKEHYYPMKWIVLAFMLLLFGCYFAGKINHFERLFNIPVPLLLYLYFDLLLKKQEKQDKRWSIAFRSFIIILTFFYLFLKDAGFTVIFFVFLFLYHVVFGHLIGGRFLSSLFGRENTRKWLSNNGITYAVSIFGILLVIAFLKYEGSLFIGLFSHIGWVLLAASALLALLLLLRFNSILRPLRYVYAFASILLLAGGLMELLPGLTHYVSDKINNNAHIKYRAEVQKLSEDEKIDDLIAKYDFKSTDINYIMRSAHNQWFINQYLKAGENQTRYFTVQPHSNQGSTYPTQTTDLVITRYVLAEHGKYVVPLFLLLFLILVFTYCNEVRLGDSDKQSSLGSLLLLFTIALLVYLSATNRIVFIGQDFPFISIQSFVAIVFPLGLLFITLFSVTKDKVDSSEREVDGEAVHSRKKAVPIMLGITAILSILVIKPQGKDQTEDQFNISDIIQQLSIKVETLDRSLLRYQLLTDQRYKNRDEIWESFLKDKSFSEVWTNAIEDDSKENSFYRSLLEYFNTRQAVKNNPDELLHLRKRNGYWRLSVNKSYFFIPSMMDNMQWRGEVLAAKTNRDYYLKNLKSQSKQGLSYDRSYETNILPNAVKNSMRNSRLAYFDKSWSNTGEPMLLINTYQSIETKQYFNIESEDGLYKGSSSDHQMAMQIRKGDYVTLNTLDRLGDEKEVWIRQYSQDKDYYLAKNIWMNGYQRLFYPLGKESLWSYQFSNAVSKVFGEEESLRDSTIRVSIDYELQKRFFEYLDTINVQKIAMSSDIIVQLLDFQELPESEMINQNNVSPFYYDSDRGLLMCKRGSSQDIRKVVDEINKRIAKGDRDMDTQSRIITAIDEVMERKFDFSAVVLDGNGRIRALFDHTKKRNNLNPNNIRFYNKMVSDLYMSGSTQSERDIFGNKALQIIPSGPGSTFKPIAYTSITSQQKIAWDKLDVLSDYMKEGENCAFEKEEHGVKYYKYYGGLDLKKKKLGLLAIAGKSYSLKHDNYLTYSNNLYHSVIILMGMQPMGQVEKIFRPAGKSPIEFPIISYNDKRVSLNPDVWFAKEELNIDNGIMNIGLLQNFNLRGDYVRDNERYSNYYGEDELYKLLFERAGYQKLWIYPETGSLNTFDRKIEPKLRNGFNQMLTGAYPLEVTPLQMATMGMRLATLNKTEHLTTLDDSKKSAPEYSFFNTPTWGEEYYTFYKQQVMGQLRSVPKTGSAWELSGVAKELEQRKLYMYAKTGTLNDGREDADKENRIKNLLLIITNKELEEITRDDLKSVRYYVIYMSFIGVNQNTFNNVFFAPIIRDVVNSELFNNYMYNE